MVCLCFSLSLRAERKRAWQTKIRKGICGYHADLVLTENWTLVRSTRGPFPWGMDGWVSTTKELKGEREKQKVASAEGGRGGGWLCFQRQVTSWSGRVRACPFSAAVPVFGLWWGRFGRRLSPPARPAFWGTLEPGTDTLPRGWTYAEKRVETITDVLPQQQMSLKLQSSPPKSVKEGQGRDGEAWLRTISPSDPGRRWPGRRCRPSAASSATPAAPSSPADWSALRSCPGASLYLRGRSEEAKANVGEGEWSEEGLRREPALPSCSRSPCWWESGTSCSVRSSPPRPSRLQQFPRRGHSFRTRHKRRQAILVISLVIFRGNGPETDVKTPAAYLPSWRFCIWNRTRLAAPPDMTWRAPGTAAEQTGVRKTTGALLFPPTFIRKWDCTCTSFWRLVNLRSRSCWLLTSMVSCSICKTWTCNNKYRWEE